MGRSFRDLRRGLRRVCGVSKVVRSVGAEPCRDRSSGYVLRWCDHASTSRLSHRRMRLEPLSISGGGKSVYRAA